VDGHGHIQPATIIIITTTIPNVSNKYFASQFQSASISLNDAALAITGK